MFFSEKTYVKKKLITVRKESDLNGTIVSIDHLDFISHSAYYFKKNCLVLVTDAMLLCTFDIRHV